MVARVGSCSAVWDHALAVDEVLGREGLWKSTRKLLLSPFLRALRDLGWPNNPHTRSLLVASLDYFGCGFVSRSDLEWLDAWEPPEFIYADPDPQALQQLNELIRKRYAHPLSAWRSLFDRDDSNSVSWLEFKDACEKLKFKGNIGGAWRALDTDLSGHISLLEFDADSARILVSFKAWCMKHFGSVQLMFRQLDRDESGSLSYPELRRACRRLKWNGDVHLLFNCLDTDGVRMGGRRNISLQELFFLDSWEVSEDDFKAHEENLSRSPDSPRSDLDHSTVSSPSHHSPQPPHLPKLKETRSAPTLRSAKPSPAKPVPKRATKFLQKLLKEYGADGLLK